jgi:hypothetical protein
VGIIFAIDDPGVVPLSIMEWERDLHPHIGFLLGKCLPDFYDLKLLGFSLRRCVWNLVLIGAVRWRR